jgi:hypothetical protein
MGRYSNQGEMASHLEELSVMDPEPVPIVRRKPKQVHRRLRSDEVDQLVIDYEAGVPINDLVARYRIDQSTVTQHVKRAGVRMRYPKLVSQEIEEATGLYCSGLSLAAVGKHFGIDAYTVRRTLLKVGVQMRDHQGRER